MTQTFNRGMPAWTRGETRIPTFIQPNEREEMITLYVDWLDAETTAAIRAYPADRTIKLILVFGPPKRAVIEEPA